MKMKFSPHQEDMLLLKWPVLWLAVALLVSAVWYGAAHQYRGGNERELKAARAERTQAISSVHQIEEEARIVRDYCDRYQQLLEDRVVGEEDRLELVETVDRVRARQLLYPLQLDVEQQAILPLGRDGSPGIPGEGMEVRVSRILVSISLLHEEDLFRLFDGLNAMKLGLFVAEDCSIKRLGSDKENARPVLRQNLSSSCKILWLTVSKTTDVGGEQPEPPPPM
ncbi:MAG: hypothetical protein KJ630_08935 [Proteobacteria bacterium]|nr:hypothetical protein [Pseudomonadota bacterium]